MDVHPAARTTVASERTCDMADLRKCIGSAKFGIEAHEAPVADFPVQPSQKDGFGRMCKAHWNAYTKALRKAAATAKAEAAADGTPAPEPTEAKPSGRRGKASEPVAESGEAIAG
jgi:hypothetical protein